MSLKEAELTKRSKELDAREEYIDAKAKELEKAPITLSVYEAQVKAKKNQLAELQHLIAESTNKDKELEGQVKTAYQQHERKKELYAVKTSSKESELNLLNESIQNKIKELKSIDKEIEQRQSYLKQQEHSIAEAIEMANEKLLDLRDEINKQESINNAVKNETVNIKTDLTEVKLQHDKISQHTEVQINNLKMQKLKLEQELKRVESDVLIKSDEYKTMSDKIDVKLRILNEKEISIVAKQNAIRFEKQELDVEKRRFVSLKHLYGED
jgi:hypothetical protein